MHNLIVMIFYIHLGQTKRHLKQNYRFKATVKSKKYTSDDKICISSYSGRGVVVYGPGPDNLNTQWQPWSEPVSSIVTITISRWSAYIQQTMVSISVLRKLFMQIISVQTHSLSKLLRKHWLQKTPAFSPRSAKVSNSWKFHGWVRLRPQSSHAYELELVLVMKFVWHCLLSWTIVTWYWSQTIQYITSIRFQFYLWEIPPSPGWKQVTLVTEMLPICLILVIVSLETGFCQSEFALSGQSGARISSCRTVGGPSPGKSCQFPFTFAGERRTGCISDTDPDGRLWCSTQVDADGQHVGGGGHWGYCPSDCPSHQEHWQFKT